MWSIACSMRPRVNRAGALSYSMSACAGVAPTGNCLDLVKSSNRLSVAWRLYFLTGESRLAMLPSHRSLFDGHRTTFHLIRLCERISGMAGCPGRARYSSY